MFVVLCLLVGLVHSACFNNDVIKFGTSLSNSGKYATKANHLRKGYNLAIQKINAKGGVTCDGKQYTFGLVEVNDDSTTAAVTQNYNTLKDNADVNFLVGPYSSSLSIAAADVAQANNKVIVHGGASSDTLLTKGSKNFLTYTVASKYFESAMDELYAKGARKFCLVAINTAFPKSVAEGTVALANSKGYKINQVADIKYHNSADSAHVRSTLLECMNEKADAVLASTNVLEDAKSYITEAKALGFYPKGMVITVYGSSPTLTNSVGSEALGILGPTQWSEHLVASEADEIFGTAAQFATAYYASNQHDDNPPSYQLAGASAAILAYYYAIKSTTPGQTVTQDSIAAALASMNQPSFWGQLAWESNGSINKPIYSTQIQVNADSIFPVVAPPAFATTLTGSSEKFVLKYPNYFSTIDEKKCEDPTVALVDAPAVSTCFPGRTKLIFGASLSKSGDYKPKADHLRKGYKLAIDEINRKYGGLQCGGVRYPLKLKEATEDDGSTEAIIKRNYKSLSDDADVDFLLGPYSSKLSAAASEIAQNEDQILIHGGASSDALLKFGGKNFLTYTTASKYFVPAMKELQRKGAKKMCIISIDSSFPRAVAEGTVGEAKKLGITINDKVKYHTAKDTQHIQETLKECMDGGYDAVLASTNKLPDAAAYVLEAKKINYFPKALVITVYGPSPLLTNEVGDDALGVVGPTQWSQHLPGLEQDNVFGTSADYAKIYDKSAYSSKGAPPSYQTAGASAAILSYYYAIKAAAVSNPGVQITQQMIVDALKSLNQETFWGLLQWNSDGSIKKPMYATQIRVNAGDEGIFPVIAPISSASTGCSDNGCSLNYPSKLNKIYSSRKVSTGTAQASTAKSSSAMSTMLIVIIVIFVLQTIFIGFLVYRERRGAPMFSHFELKENDVEIPKISTGDLR